MGFLRRRALRLRGSSCILKRRRYNRETRGRYVTNGLTEATCVNFVGLTVIVTHIPGDHSRSSD